MSRTSTDNQSLPPQQPTGSRVDASVSEGAATGVLDDAYDALAAHSPQGSIYCQRWWLDAVAEGRWRILTMGDAQNLHAAWPIVTRQRGRREDVVMPPMTQKLGILFPPADPERKYAEHLSRQHQLIEGLIEQLPRTGLFQHRFHERFTNHLPFCWHDFQQTTLYTYLLPDLSNVDKVWSAFRSRPRTAIRGCRKSGMQVIDDLDFEHLLDLNELTFKRQGLSTPVSRETLRRIDGACVANAGRRVFAARDGQGRVHAALYLVYHNRTAYYLLLGSDPDLRRSNAVSLLFWEAIRFASTVADVFDFEGSMMRNVEVVLRDFGGKQTPYSLITHPGPPSLPVRAIRKIGRFSHSVRSRLKRSRGRASTA